MEQNTQQAQAQANEQAKDAPKKDNASKKETIKKVSLYGGIGTLLVGAGAVAGFFFARRT